MKRLGTEHITAGPRRLRAAIVLCVQIPYLRGMSPPSRPLLEVVQPPHFARPRGYANGIITRGPLLHVAGQVGWEANGSFASAEFAPQFARALDNVLDVVRAAGARPEHVARMTVYVTSVAEYKGALPALGEIWKSRFGKHYPAMALVCVAGLVEDGALVEIEAVAALPDDAAPGTA